MNQGPEHHGGFAELAKEWGQMPTRYRDKSLPPSYWENGRKAADVCAEELPPERYPRIAELGCGPGRTTRWLARRYEHVYAVDIAQGMLDEIEPPENVTKVLDDGTSLTEKLGPIDGLFSYLVLMHNRHDDVARIFEEIGRVLSPGGRAVIQLPVYSSAIEAGDWSQVSQWTTAELHDLAGMAGLEPTAVRAHDGDLVGGPMGQTDHFDELQVLERPFD